MAKPNPRSPPTERWEVILPAADGHPLFIRNTAYTYAELIEAGDIPPHVRELLVAMACDLIASKRQ